MAISHRRVVTGLDAEGRSCLLFDGPVETRPGHGALVWHSETIPADNSGTADPAAKPFSLDYLRGPGSNFLLVELEPNDEQPFMRATNTLDYAVVLRGEIMLALDTGEVHLRAGDLVVHRGVLHGWRAVGAGNALMAVVTVPSNPVGNGATI